MNAEKDKRGPLPPYIAYKTFKTYLDRFRVALPGRIDRSVLTSLSGAQQGQLLAALSYLHLINDHGVPTDKLARLVSSEGADHQKVLKDVLATHYSFLFKDGFDLTRASPRQLEDEFMKAGMSGDTVRKGVGFFIAAAKDAGLHVSPFIKAGKRTRSSGQRIRRTSGMNQNITGPEDQRNNGSPPDSLSLKQVLLAKFPSFDPGWSPEVQAKWFEAFERLMGSVGKGEQESDD